MIPVMIPVTQEFVVPVLQLNHCIRYFQMLPKTVVG